MSRGSDRGGGPPGPLFGGPSPLQVRSRRRRTRARRWLYGVLVRIVSGLLWLLDRSGRSTRLHGEEHLARLVAAGRPFVVGAWHGQALIVATELLRRLPDPGRLTFLVSPSVDGDPVSTLLEGRGARVVRGSATRSAVASLRALHRELRRGAIPVLFVDGPSGPAGVYKAGPLLLAQLSSVPLLPVASGARPAWRPGTWDRHLVPLPFTRRALVFGEPVEVPAGVVGEELEALCRREGERLDALTRRARELLATG